MAIQQTQWSPETCSCTIVYEWDDAIPQDLRIHALRNIVHKGPEHNGIIDASILPTLWDENRRKNLTFDLAKQELPEIDNERFSWSWTEGRVLEVTIKNMGNIPAALKARLQAACDLRFGPGKVVIL